MSCCCLIFQRFPYLHRTASGAAYASTHGHRKANTGRDLVRCRRDNVLAILVVSDPAALSCKPYIGNLGNQSFALECGYHVLTSNMDFFRPHTACTTAIVSCVPQDLHPTLRTPVRAIVYREMAESKPATSLAPLRRLESLFSLALSFCTLRVGEPWLGTMAHPLDISCFIFCGCPHQRVTESKFSPPCCRLPDRGEVIAVNRRCPKMHMSRR